MTAITVSVADAAEMLGLDQTTVRKHIAARRIQAKKDGRKILVVVDSLPAFVKSLPDASPAEDDA